MNHPAKLVALALACLALPAVAGVSAEEAARLNNELTPFGAERAGNKDGSIPAWTGGWTKPDADFKNGGTRPDPFKDDKPLYSVSARNAEQYADKLSDGMRNMFKRYPESFRIDVYPTRRTAAAPQWVYDNTLKNATRGSLKGTVPDGVYGGIPFPIPKSGEELMWNHLLRWRGSNSQYLGQGIQVTADGARLLTVSGVADQSMPYYEKDGSLAKFNGDYWRVRIVNDGPPIRAGEAIVGHQQLDPDKSETWLYMVGQRRVRKVPSACCDTPTGATGGLMTFDELNVFDGRLDRFDWTILGKKELLIPYNSNRSFQPAKAEDLVGPKHLNPDHVRWELHRVWIVEAKVKAGVRHQMPRSVYYLDEDSWVAVLGDRWDANGRLWKSVWNIPAVMPDLPGVVDTTTGFYDHIGSAYYANSVYAGKPLHFKLMPRYPDVTFTPESLAGLGVR
jgi:hypothetical protein